MSHTERRIWNWKVEPGMEDAFDDLLGWLLSSQRDAPTESAATISRLGDQRDPAFPALPALRRPPVEHRTPFWTPALPRFEHGAIKTERIAEGGSPAQEIFPLGDERGRPVHS